MGTRTKKTRKKNKSKAQLTRPKRKRKATLDPSKVAIIVAIISFLGSVLTAIIDKNRIEEPPLIPLQAHNEYCLDLSPPTISSNVKLPDGSCIEEPTIGVVALCSNPLEDDAICARIGKPRLHEDTLPMVPRENINVKSQLNGNRLVAEVDSESFIRKQYKSTPHGLYRVEFDVFDPCNSGHASSKIEFNYVYKENFIEPQKVLIAGLENVKNIPDQHGGLEIRNWSKHGNFVSAKLKQDFDFNTNFCITGFFTVEYENELDPSGFDICLCDRWGEKLSIVLADGGLNAFSIKMKDEERKDKDVLKMLDKPRIGRTTKENTVFNYFKILIWQHKGQSRCSLYVQSGSPAFRQDSLVHERVIDTSYFSKSFARITLKLWKTGILKLYNLEVAEVPST